MSTISKTVANRLINARAVTASFDVHGPDTIEDLAAVFQKAGIAQFDAASVHNLMSTFSEFLKSATSQLKRTETAYVVEISNDGDKRDERDEAIAELRDDLMTARTLLSAVGDRNSLRNWGMSDLPPTKADTLLIYANHCVVQLRQNARTLSRNGVTVDTRALADSLDAPRARLQAALDSLNHDGRANQLALDKRNTVLDEWNLAYGTSATILSELFRLAGRQNLAKRVRPTTRRVSGEVNVEDNPDDEDQEQAEPTVENQDTSKSEETQDA